MGDNTIKPFNEGFQKIIEIGGSTIILPIKQFEAICSVITLIFIPVVSSRNKLGSWKPVISLQRYRTTLAAKVYKRMSERTRADRRNARKENAPATSVNLILIRLLRSVHLSSISSSPLNAFICIYTESLSLSISLCSSPLFHEAPCTRLHNGRCVCHFSELRTQSV